MPDWEAEGLLAGLDDEASRAARTELLEELHAGGVTIAELRRAVAEERLAVLPVERRLAGEARYTAAQAAERAGVDLETLLAFQRAYGIAIPGPDEVAYGDEDVEDAKRGRILRRSGLDDDDLLAVEQLLGLGLARYAEAFRLAFAKAFIEPGDTEVEVARRYAAAFEGIRPLAEPHLGHVLFLHLRQLVRSDVLSAEERRTGRPKGREQVAVAFADLVGFTALGERVGEEELGGVASRLAVLATEALTGPVRLVKTLGDAVMLIAPDPAPLLEAVLDMVEGAQAAALPELRAGVAYGPAVNRWGDWYGSTVNLASRLTARARPGAVLAAEAVRLAAPDAVAWSEAGEKRFKGFASPVRTHRARRRAPA